MESCNFLSTLQNKINLMISNFTIITVPQWAIFAAITVVIYGWVEQKKAFGMVGSIILMALGIFAGWAIYNGLLMPEGLFDTTEAMDGEELFLPDELPIEGRLLPFYWGLIVNSVIALGALITDIMNKKVTRVLKVVMCIIGLLIFFGMIGVAKM
jgi:hypothetical protein